MMPKPHAGSPLVPLILSSLIAAAAVTLAAGMVPDIATPDGSAAARMLTNDFCRVIFTLGATATVYALMEYFGSAMDRAGRLVPGAWLCGRSAEALSPALWDAQQQRRLAPLQYAIFALPLLGFIGTVIGISGAIGGLGIVFDSDDRGAALADVLGDLRYAFDTTFAGLAGVLPAALGQVLIRASNIKLAAELQTNS